MELQKEFVLIPTQREPSTFTRSGWEKQGKVIERQCAYYADFYYLDVKTGNHICEDSKGFTTAEYIIKRKLMLWVHGIRVIEV